MMQNNHSFSMDDARRLAETDAGKKLLALLQAQNSPQLQKAMAQATAGDYTQLKSTLGSLMASPEAQALLKQLENNRHG